MSITRLLTLTGLAVAGALCAGTAASVYTASLPRQQVHAAAVRIGTGDSAAADGWYEGAEPGGAALIRRAADRGTGAAERLRAARTAAAGACLDPREVLFGTHEARRRALGEIAAKLADLPQGTATVAAAQAMLDAFDDASEVWVDRRTRADAIADAGEGIPALLDVLVPDRLTRRVTLCRLLLAD